MTSKIIEREIISLYESQTKMIAAGRGKDAIKKTLLQFIRYYSY